MKVYDGASWITATSAGATSLLQFKYVATAGQTSFSGAATVGGTLTYTVNNIVVFLNGVALDSTDYTASTGTSVVLGTAAALNDELVIIAFKSFTVADTYTKGEVDGFAVKLTGNQTVAGVKTLSSNPVLDAGTANGVAYLDGSKVLTTGSALVFDGTNLGLGVTPSAWGGSGLTALQIRGLGLMASSTQTWAFANAYFDGTNTRYINDGFSTYYRQNDSGTHKWYTAASGTAGNAITFTQAMTLDASGVAYIGATSGIGSRLNLAKDTNSTVENLLWLRNSGTGYKGARLTFGEYTTVNGYVTNQYISSGPAWCTDIGATDNVRFFTGSDPGSERARIDSSGSFFIACTSSPSSATTGTAVVSNQIRNSVGSTANTSQIVFNNPNGIVGTINTSGSATSYNTSSDYRLKNTIAPITGALAKVALLKPCTYKWNADDSDGEGFIAHELAEVVPQCVTGEKDAVDADGNPQYQGIDTSFLVATLTAAIQEQNQLITQLTARISALESA
jgi:hypothetical protein